MKKVKMLSIMFLTSVVGNAQTLEQGQQAIDDAAAQVGNYYGTVATLIFAIAAIVALVGGIRIFLAWNSGDRDIGKMVVGWFGACIFLVAIGAIITAFFGVGA